MPSTARVLRTAAQLSLPPLIEAPELRGGKARLCSLHQRGGAQAALKRMPLSNGEQVSTRCPGAETRNPESWGPSFASLFHRALDDSESRDAQGKRLKSSPTSARTAFCPRAQRLAGGERIGTRRPSWASRRIRNRLAMRRPVGCRHSGDRSFGRLGLCCMGTDSSPGDPRGILG